MNDLKAYLEITALQSVEGKDDTGATIALTKVSSHRYDKNEAGDIGPDHNDFFTHYFVGNLNAQQVEQVFVVTDLKDWDITVIADSAKPAVAGGETAEQTV